MVKLGPGSETGRIKLGDRVGIKVGAHSARAKGGFWVQKSYSGSRMLAELACLA